jgi:hypothetical protein
MANQACDPNGISCNRGIGELENYVLRDNQNNLFKLMQLNVILVFSNLCLPRSVGPLQAI